MHNLHTRIEHESKEDMPYLKSTLFQSEPETIAKSFIRTKQIVPTRSHPDAPTNSPLMESLAGLLVAPIDKLMDLMKSFPEEERK